MASPFFHGEIYQARCHPHKPRPASLSRTRLHKPKSPFVTVHQSLCILVCNSVSNIALSDRLSCLYKVKSVDELKIGTGSDRSGGYNTVDWSCRGGLGGALTRGPGTCPYVPAGVQRAVPSKGLRLKIEVNMVRFSACICVLKENHPYFWLHTG
jgi:hypothetical protein